MKFDNVYSVFREQAAKYGHRPVFFTREGGGWKSQTWSEFENKVHDVGCAFLAKGLSKGASVAILAGNIPEWTIVDIAAIATGGVSVGLYPTSSREQCEFIIKHSDAEFVVVDSIVQLEKVLSSDIPNVKEIFVVDAAAALPRDDRVSTFENILVFGRENRDEYLPKVEKLGFGTNI